MAKISAFFKLIRWPNLLFIALTQVLFYFCIYYSPAINSLLARNSNLFWLLVLASVFIAAGGNIINDYFDFKIDKINKPQRALVSGRFARRTAILFHLIFSAIGLLVSAYISYKTGIYVVLVGNILAVIALWFYSTHFKRSLLTGNIVIAGLTAWVLIVVYFLSGAAFIPWGSDFSDVKQPRFFKIFIVYAGFAFIITLIREVVKDLEDIEGDLQNGCKTMPIVWGVNASKIFAAVWMVVCAGSLLIIALYTLQSGWYLISLYNLLLVVAPLVFAIFRLTKATAAKDYNYLSGVVKFVIFTGILSMIFFLFLQ